jgi:anti-sigma B factor antagonist
MQLTSRSVDSVAVLALEGWFDARTAPAVREWFATATSSEPARVVVNLAEVTFIDSSALAALVNGMKRCHQQGGSLRLSNLQAPVRSIFEMTRLDKALEIYPDEASAVRAPWERAR